MSRWGGDDAEDVGRPRCMRELGERYVAEMIQVLVEIALGAPSGKRINQGRGGEEDQMVAGGAWKKKKKWHAPLSLVIGHIRNSNCNNKRPFCTEGRGTGSIPCCPWLPHQQRFFMATTQSKGFLRAALHQARRRTRVTREGSSSHLLL